MLITITFILHTFLLNFMNSTPDVAIQQEASIITIIVSGVSSDEGKLMVGLYDSSSNWLGKTYAGEVIKIENGQAQCILTNIPHGTYGVSIVHDENDNDEMDTGYFGIPTEAYACSNGAKGRFGPPSWEDAKFTVNEKSTEVIVKF